MSRVVPRGVQFALAATLALASAIAGTPALATTATPIPTVPPGAPGAPTLGSVSPGPGSNELTVAFTAGPDGGSAVIAYELSADAGVTWLPCLPRGATACATQSMPAQPGAPVVLRAVNANGAGPGSEPVTVAMPMRRTSVTASFNAASNLPEVDGSRTVLGVATLPQLRFSRAIPDKAAVERHLMVVSRDEATGKEHFVAGSWGWVSDRAVVFRPRTFWPGRATITVTSDMGRTLLGRQGDGRWLIGSPALDRTWVFRTARKLIARVDGERHRMVVTIDGAKRKSFGVSLGTTSWETRNGVKVIGTDKLADKTYTSQALGITDPDEQYALDAKWNTRLTPTGEFIHTATWAYGRIGRWNGSHGCTNMFEQDAKWIYDTTIPGDPVVYTRTGGSLMEPWNGPGGLWNIPWDEWLQRSALSNPTGTPVTTSPFVRTAPARQASA